MHRLLCCACSAAQYWNDPVILALNPWLYSLLGNTTMVPIQTVRGCGTSVAVAPVGYAYARLLKGSLSTVTDPTVFQCINTYFTPNANLTGVTTLSNAAIQCVDQLPYYLHVRPAPRTTHLPAITLVGT